MRSIGVSNFTVSQLEDLIANSSTIPAVNQVEFHPYLVQNELHQYCKSKGLLPHFEFACNGTHCVALLIFSPTHMCLGIAVTAYSPLGSAHPCHNGPSCLKSANINRIAAQHSKTPAQVIPLKCFPRIVCNVLKKREIVKLFFLNCHHRL